MDNGTDILTDILEHAKNMHGVIENSTVYTKCIRRSDDGGGEDEYYGKDKELVLKKAMSVVDVIDPYQSPSMNSPWHGDDGYWHVNVRWWGLGG